MTNNLPFLQVLVKPLTIQLPFLFPGTSKLCWCQQNIIKMSPKTSHLHCHIHVCALHMFFFWSCVSHRDTRSNVILAKHIRVDALNKFFLLFILPIYLQYTTNSANLCETSESSASLRFSATIANEWFPPCHYKIKVASITLYWLLKNVKRNIC